MRARTTATRATTRALLAGALVVWLAAGCSSAAPDGPASVALEFANEARSDAARACGLLAPRVVESLATDHGDCSTGLADAALPDTSATADSAASGPNTVVAGRSARVVLPGQVIFLVRFDAGWKVTAAGCQRQSADLAVPYECSVQE